MRWYRAMALRASVHIIHIKNASVHIIHIRMELRASVQMGCVVVILEKALVRWYRGLKGRTHMYMGVVSLI